ncbi:SdrD B-like domain-containing protein [Lentzea waywayandensis]|uniref:SdrD B-like domain-containing protein n=1 Tax=Lentzea waywayandensis TaxID=84724 RepID=UPI0011606418|nr:SdrD B-like domain-containing protein [Lentzea waywayandensis]
MSDRSVSRAVLGIGALATVAVLAFSTAAFAQDDPSSTPPTPTETSAPQSSEPAPTPSSEPAPPPVVTAAATGDIDGVLYTDKNGNKQQDAGEAAPDVELMVSAKGAEHRTTTGAEGKFSFHDLAPGRYDATYWLEDPWIVHRVGSDGDLITVEPDKTAQVVARAERPYAEQFSVSASLDRDSYRMPATATVTLTFANATNNKISNIRARCDHEGFPNALGRGKAWNALVTNGVSLAPGERRSIPVTEVIPEGAGRAGNVMLDCEFAPNPDWNSDGVWARARAKVSSSTNYSMVVGEDKNADDRIDGDEAVSGVKVVLLDPKARGQVSEGTSDADGRIEFFGVKAGVYRAAVLGSWGFSDAGQEQVEVTEQGGFAYGLLKHANPADVRASAKFGKQSYESHETVTLDLTITNVGGKTAEQVKLWGDVTVLDVAPEQWGDFLTNRPGIRLAAGESRTFSVSGRIVDTWDGELVVNGELHYLGQEEITSGYRAVADVVETRGDITGVVYADKNGNGQQDPGEAAPEVLVEASGGATHGYLTATTDANGGFTFKDVSSGRYWISYTVPGGWLVHDEVNPGPITWVEPSAPAHVTVRADRPYSELIEATMVLDKDTYMVGEIAKITITLKNITHREIRGVQAGCNPLRHQDQLGGVRGPMPEGWGELRKEAAGVTLVPGESKTITVTEPVPDYARFRQQVAVGCSFAPNATFNHDGPWALDVADVLVGLGAVQGRVAHDLNHNGVVDPGEALAGVRVLLLTDKEYGLQVADTLSDADGTVRFDRVPTGEFWAGIDGPWTFEGEAGHVDVRLDEVVQRDFFVVPAPRATPPAEQHSGGSKALARTGASVLGLGVIAVLLVAFGFGARAAGRRRTS